MNLSKYHVTTVLVFLSLFLLTYFGCDTKNKSQKAVEKSRAQNIELISVERLIREAKPGLSANGNSDLLLLEQQLNEIQEDKNKVDTYKAMASLWYSEKHPLISGYYAEKVANILQTDTSAWSIAGTTYAIAGQRVTDETEKKHAVLKSRSAFENVLSLDPENVESRINLALSYVEVPENGMPMKGILMLLDLNKEFPQNTSVLMQLGRLALGTNQLDKAVERLSQVIEIDPSIAQAHCLLAEVYLKKGNKQKAESEMKLCDLK